MSNENNSQQFLQLSAISDLALWEIQIPPDLNGQSFVEAVSDLSIEVTQKDESGNLYSKKISMENLFSLISSYISKIQQSGSLAYLKVNNEDRNWTPKPQSGNTYYIQPQGNFAISSQYASIEMTDNGEININAKAINLAALNNKSSILKLTPGDNDNFSIVLSSSNDSSPIEVRAGNVGINLNNRNSNNNAPQIEIKRYDGNTTYVDIKKCIADRARWA